MAHRYKVVQGGPYPHLITCTIVKWIPVFVSGPYFEIITKSLQHVREHRALALHACVIMPTHLHAVVTALRDDLSDIMRDFKKFTSRAIYQCAEQSADDLLPWLFRQAARNEPHSRFKVWQDEFHPKMLFSEDVFRQKVEYVHANPVRSNLVTTPEHWYYSSAAFYTGSAEGPFETDVAEW